MLQFVFVCLAQQTITPVVDDDTRAEQPVAESDARVLSHQEQRNVEGFLGLVLVDDSKFEVYRDHKKDSKIIGQTEFGVSQLPEEMQEMILGMSAQKIDEPRVKIANVNSLLIFVKTIIYIGREYGKEKAEEILCSVGEEMCRQILERTFRSFLVYIEDLENFEDYLCDLETPEEQMNNLLDAYKAYFPDKKFREIEKYYEMQIEAENDKRSQEAKA